MTLKLGWAVPAAIVLIAVASTTPTSQRSAGAAPTFNKDVAPIVYAHCAVCHRPGEAAPMSLLSYQDAKTWARAIKTKVVGREMPPWYADPRFGDFSNRPTITQAQIDVLAAWADAGAPEGPGRAPKAPTFRSAWSAAMNRPPDAVIEAPFEFEIPARQDPPTFTVWVKLPFPDDRFVEAMQILPSNRKVVHHSGISLAELPARTKIGRGAVYPGGPVLDGVPVYSDGRPFRATSGDDFGYPLLFYVPGGGFLRFPEGVAKRLPAGRYLSWSMHYVAGTGPERVKMRLGLWFARGDVRHLAESYTVNMRRVANGQEVAADARGGPASPPTIKPGEANYTITGYLTFPDAVTIYAAWPHMHFRGRDMTFIVTYPGGREETILSVPNYNPHWQATYEFTRPLRLPAKTSIRAIAHYDNSRANPHNPDPTQEVIWGPQADNEMFLPFLEVSVDQ